MENMHIILYVYIFVCIVCRIEFKIITLVYKSLHGLAPQYLANLLTRKVQCREGLHSNDKPSQLEIPHTTRKTFAARAFSVLGPQLWNQLPTEIQDINSYTIFKKTLRLSYRGKHLVA